MAYLGGMVVINFAPRRHLTWAQVTHGHAFMGVLCDDWNAWLSDRWYTGDDMWHDDEDVKDLVPVWELRDVGPGIMALFGTELCKGIAGVRDFRLLFDKLLEKLEPGSQELAAAIDALNVPLRRVQGPRTTALDRFDMDAAIEGVLAGA